MPFELVIFDLDGTLLNTLDDLTAATNGALAEFGFPGQTSEAVRTYIGNGVGNLIRRAVPAGAPEAVVSAVLSRFKAIYTENVNVRTRPYPGIVALLETLNRRGILCAVNSNKVDNAVQSLCDAHFPGLLSMALGEREGMPRKPAPDGVEYIMRQLGVPRARTLYVGDGDTDLRTAENARIDCAWVSWGYRARTELEGIPIPHACASVAALGAFILGDAEVNL